MGILRRRGFAGVIALIIFVVCWGGGSPAALALGGPPPPIGEAAPTFTLPTNSGAEDIALEDYRGRWVVLYFYPQDGTSGCTLEARRFQESRPDFQALNAEIVGVSGDDVASHASFCAAEGIEFPLLSDVNGNVSKAYGSWLTGRSLRHTYLIDPAGILRERFLGVRPAIHSQEVLTTLRSMLMPPSTISSQTIEN